MDSLERTFLKVTLAAISAVTVTNMIVNYRGTVEVGKVIVGAPVALVNALRR